MKGDLRAYCNRVNYAIIAVNVSAERGVVTSDRVGAPNLSLSGNQQPSKARQLRSLEKAKIASK